MQVENFMVATSQIAQTTLRSVLGQHVLDELLSERDKINAILQEIIDEATSPWGIKVSIVEVKDVEIPSGMQRAMARQAEAERERRAKVIAAEGEFQASERLKDAANVMAENPIALQLRFLQTMLEISSERSTTMILPLPLELFARSSARARSRADGAPLASRAAPRPDLGPLGRGRARAGAPAGRTPSREPRTLPTIQSAARSTKGGRRATPPETFAIGPPGRPPDTPGWRVRVVPNKFPAFGPWPRRRRPPRRPASHAGRPWDGRRSSSTRPGTSGRSQTSACASSSSSPRRGRPARKRRARQGFRYVHALVNEGAGAGASLPHTHSQLVWLEEEPPLVAQEHAARQAAGSCVLCDVLEEEARRGCGSSRSATGSSCSAPSPVGSPTRCSPLRSSARMTRSRAAAGRGAGARGRRVRRLQVARGRRLPEHLAPRRRATGTWRSSRASRVLAGLELGAGYFVNTMAPESAAGVLRES